jgi:hypothetical protein
MLQWQHSQGFDMFTDFTQKSQYLVSFEDDEDQAAALAIKLCPELARSASVALSGSRRRATRRRRCGWAM